MRNHNLDNFIADMFKSGDQKLKTFIRSVQVLAQSELEDINLYGSNPDIGADDVYESDTKRQLAKEGLETDTIEAVPDWATSYLMYGDESDLSQSEKEDCDEWVERLAADGYRLIEPIEGTDNEFCSYPAFGAATSTHDWIAEKI